MTDHVRYDEIIEHRKMFVVVRADLPPGLRAAQAAHAVAEMCVHRPSESALWHDEAHGNYMIVLEAPHEVSLMGWFDYLQESHIDCELFREPDMNYAATALAALPHPDKNELFAQLPLAYSKRPWWHRFRR